MYIMREKSMEIYVSGDVEMNGPQLGYNSVLSIGLVALDIDKNVHGKFSVNLDLIENGGEHPDTMAWWAKNQKAYDATRVDTVHPSVGIRNMVDWINNLKGTKLFMGFPAVYDFAAINWYMSTYTGEAPFGHSGVMDLKAIAYAMLKPKKFKETAKRNFPKRWFDNLPHTHIAVDDALEQGMMGINILRELHGLPPIK